MSKLIFQRETETDRDRETKETERQDRLGERQTEIQRETQLDIKRGGLQERMMIREFKWEKGKIKHARISDSC